MARERKKLTLGKGAAFVKGRLKRLPQENECWEVDFRACPSHCRRIRRLTLAWSGCRAKAPFSRRSRLRTPDINDLATLLAHAMRRPLTGSGHRPRRVRVRKNPRWPELFSHLQEIGIAAIVDSDLDTLRTAFHDHRRRVRKARRAGMVQPTAEQASVEGLFPTVAQ